MPDAIAPATTGASENAAAAARPVSLSVIINNYNYEPFLAFTIESVLGQSVPVQLIVVDDCSTDGSRDVIRRYGDRVQPIFQPVNAGQAAGFNAGFAAATGDLVLFLDADDFLLPGAVETILSNYHPDTALYLYRMYYADDQGKLGGVFPPLGVPLAQGDISADVRRTGRYAGTITSGLVCARSALRHVMPIDPEAFRIGGDGYLSAVLPLYGPLQAFDTPVSAYRLHGRQHSNASPDALTKRARWRIFHDGERYKALRMHGARLGLTVADDLGEQDPLYIKERIISLMFEPAMHPIEGDRIEDLLKRARALALSQGTGMRRYLRACWWTLLAWSPPAARRRLFLYEVAPSTRPRWFTSLVRAVRRRG